MVAIAAFVRSPCVEQRKVPTVRVIAPLLAVMMVLMATPAHARGDSTVVVSTESKLVVKDPRGDQGDTEDATRGERRAGDILRLNAWQDGRSGWVSLTFRGSIVSSGVQKWSSAVTFTHRDPYEHPIIRVEIGRERSGVRIFQTDGSQILCRRTPNLITNEGRTLTTRIPRGCGWERAHRVYGYVTVDRPRFRQMAGDSVAARCHLVWQQGEEPARTERQ